MEHKGNTNKKKEIKLTSTIDRVVWTEGSASIGAKVGLEIETHFVGNGSEMKIELKDSSGNFHGNFKDKISGNRFSAQIRVPEKAYGSLIAKVKLPKHGAEMQSNYLVVLPVVKIKNLKWDKNEARRGDILTLSADIETVRDGTEAKIEIWEYDADETHDLITTIPVEIKGNKIECKWEYEYHEDTDDIPSEEDSEKGYNPPEYFFRVKVLGNLEDSEILKFKDWIEVYFSDPFGKPLADEEYTLYLPDGTERKGKLNGNGFAREENIPPGSYEISFEDEDLSEGDT